MKKITSLLLAGVMSFSITTAFAAEMTFTDVNESNWFYNDVKTAVESGLVSGKSETQYAPNDNLTYAEAIKLAACMNQLHATGSVTLKPGSPWYQTFVDYCKEKGIISKEYNYNEYVTRAGYMEIFAKALPDDSLEEINNIPDNSIPDVPSSNEYASGVYKLYRAGILAGVDDAHNCNPTANITRAEVAAILTRMMDADKRVSFYLGEIDKLTITKQPVSAKASVGGTNLVATVEVKGNKGEVDYQWQYKIGEKWVDVDTIGITFMGAKTDKLTFVVQGETKTLIRCVVKDSVDEVISNEATFTVDFE